MHGDPDWAIRGSLRYDCCRYCGARKVSRAYANLMGVVAPGWPRLVDRHGRAVMSSGWVPRTVNADTHGTDQ